MSTPLRSLNKCDVHDWTIAQLLVLAIANVQRSGDSTPAIDKLYTELYRETGGFDLSNNATRAAIKRSIIKHAKLALSNLRSTPE
jgi:hypothetical protein